MDIKENLERLIDAILHYIDVKADSVRLGVVESVSLFCSDLLAYVAAAALLLVALFFLLVACVILLAPYIGLVWSLFAVVVLLVAMSPVAYYCVKRFVANVMAAYLCRMLFKNGDEDEKGLQ